MRRSERGANLVELAVVTPLLLLLIAGVVDLGRSFQTYIVLTNAAREGARTGARLSCYSNSATQRVVYRDRIVQATIAAAAGNGVTVTNADITITPDPAGGTCQTDGAPMAVAVQRSINTIMGGILNRNTFVIVGKASMSRIGDPIVADFTP